MLIEKINWQGIFTVYLNPGYTTQELRQWRESGYETVDLPGIEALGQRKNILMSAQKLLMAQAVFPNIDQLVITSQSSTPADTETTYSGTIYTTVDADEYYRSTGGNPAQIGWNITSESANGTWGSFILITSTGSMINRALAGSVTKNSGSNLVVDFTGTVS